MINLELLTALIALIGLGFAGFLAYQIKKQKVVDQKAKEISQHIHEGAMAFLNKEYKFLASFVIVVAILIWLIPALSWKTAVCYVAGAIFSIAAGNIGMRIATRANVKTAEAAKNDLYQGLKIAFSS